MPKQSASTRTSRSSSSPSPRKSTSARTTPSTRSATGRGKTPAKRGFAAMSLQKRREIARKGVRARRAA